MSKTTIAAARTNGFVRRTHGLTADEVAQGWTCLKRNGDVVPFDCAKIRKALFRCFNSVTELARKGVVKLEPEVREAIETLVEATVEKLLKAVVNAAAAQHAEQFSVEEVQRLVLQQLWVNELFDAAEHYQNYREEHRKRRMAAPVAADVQDRFTEMQKHFPTDLQIYQFMSKFSRWRDDLGRRETWKETVHERVCPWLFSRPQAKDVLTTAEKQELADAMFNMEASPAMRVVQMAGPALDRCNVGAYNCAYAPIDDIFAFPEALYILMQGTGHGFSCETDYVDKLPRIKKQKGLTPEVIKVGDSTEEWCKSYNRGLELLWDGHDFEADTSAVRKKNTRLKTKGGRASGPEPLLDLFQFASNLIKSKQGMKLDDIDAHDLMCKTGQIVQVGGVRRAALISLSDLISQLMRQAKSGSNWYETNKQRTMANNSAVYDFTGMVPVDTFMEEWLSLMKSKSGERGIFNRRAVQKSKPKRRKTADWGCNPCAEICLRPMEFCNLSIVIARPDDTIESLKRKVRLATIFGKIQSLATDFKYIRPEWKENCEEERLLGVDITGHADCPLLRFDTPDRKTLLQILNKVVYDTDLEFSKRFGVNQSAANTTVKPGGDSSVFFDCASGISPRFAAQQVRWVRESIGSPIAKFLMDSGVPYAPAPEAPDSLLVFGFPKKAPAGATLVEHMSARQQFFNWLEWKQEWAEHSVSATIYVEEHEWPELGGLVYQHIDEVTGLSFLPRDNGIYRYAPNEALSEEKFKEFEAGFPELNWAKLVEYEAVDMTEAAQTFACVGGGCD